MPNVTGVYQKAGQAITPSGTDTLTSTPEKAGTSFADRLFVDPAKKALDAASSAERAATLSTTGEMDELSVQETINEAALALEEFKMVWEKSLKAINELPRVSMT